MTRRHRKHITIVLLVLSIVGWPLTAFTVARDEPQVVLALSWMAIILTALDGLFVVQEGEENSS